MKNPPPTTADPGSGTRASPLTEPLSVWDEPRWIVLFLILAGVALRVVMVTLAKGMMIDDAYISLRYARNLMTGDGMVYNAGERILGAPALYVPILGVLWEIERLFFGGGGRAIGYLVSGMNIVLMGFSSVLLAKRTRLKPMFVSLLPLTAFCLYLPFPDNTTCGMETTLFMLCLLLSLHLLERKNHWPASVVMGCSVFFRAEGLLWAGAAILAEKLRGRRWTAGLFMPMIVIGGAWGAIGTWYYGTPIPQNVMAKSGWVVGIWGGEGLLFHTWQVLKAFTLLPHRGVAAGSAPEAAALSIGMILVLALFVLGTLKVWRERNRDLAWSLFYIVYVLFFVLGRGAIWPSWYAVPPGLALFIVCAHGLSMILQSHLFRTLDNWNSRRLAQVLIPVISVLLIAGSMWEWNRARLRYYRILKDSYGRTGEYLATVPEGSRLLVNEIGYIGYLADRHVYDMAGIVSKEILEIRNELRREVAAADLIESFAADYVVVMTRQELKFPAGEFRAWFDENYELVLDAYPYLTYKYKKRSVGVSAKKRTRGSRIPSAMAACP